MANDTILLLHPGEMGAAIGACLVARNLNVLWVSQGRSQGTRARASAAGLKDCETMAQGLQQAGIVLSVCPPHGALDLAGDVVRAGFTGHFIDANAVSPGTSGQIAQIVTAAGAQFTDGGIIGPPPVLQTKARLYLSGSDTMRLAHLFDGGPLSAIALPPDAGPTAASALKMCFAGWNKARTALLINLRTLAMQSGVDDALLAEWEQMDPSVMRFFDAAKPAGTVMGSARKAWRWDGEMREIAATFEAAGLPAGFHLGAAEVFERLAAFKDAGEPPTIEALANALRAPDE